MIPLAMNYTFSLEQDYIELNKLLKVYWVGESWGNIKHMIREGGIIVDWAVEERIRRKLVWWEQVICEEENVVIDVLRAT